MAKGSVKLSILSTYDNKGEQQAEKAMEKFARRFGTMNDATNQWELDGPTTKLAEMSIKADQMAASWQRASDKIISVGENITKYVSGPAAIIAGASVKLASDFEDSMAKVSTIMDDTMTVDAMGDAILKLSTNTGKSATELAEAAYQAQSAGVATQDTIAFLEQAVNLAKTGFTDTTTAVDTLSTIVNAYGLSADEVSNISDKLVQTQNAGKTTVGELAASMGNVIPTAAAYSVNLDNLATAYVTLTKQGINTANSTTYINGMLTELADEGSTVSQILREQTGKSFTELMEDGQSLGDVIGILSDSVDGDSTAFANLWGNVRAGKGALAIANSGVDEFNLQLEGMENSTGNVYAALGKLDTASAKLKKSLNALKNMGIELGSQFLEAATPLLEELVGKTKQAVTWFTNLDDRTKRNIAKFIAFTAAVGPAVTMVGKLVGVGAKVIKTYGSVTASLAKAAAGGSKLAASFASLNIAKLGGIGLATAAIGALTVIIGKYIADEVKFTNANRKMSDAMSKLRDPASDAAYAIEGMGTASAVTTGNLRDLKDAHTEMIDGWAAEADRVSGNAALLEYYTGIIESHAGQVDGDARKQAELTTAVEGYNQIMGTSIEVIDAQTGMLSTNTDEIRANADEYVAAEKKKAASQAYGEAWLEQQQAIQQYNTELDKARELEELYRNTTDPTEREAYAAAIDEQRIILQDLARVVNDDTEAMNGYNQLMAEADGLTYDATATMEGFLTANGSDRWSNMGVNVVDFGQKLEDLGVTTEDLANLTPEQLEIMAQAYQTSTGSMLATMDSFGGDMAQKAQDYATVTGTNFENALVQTQPGVDAAAAGVMQSVQDEMTGAASASSGYATDAGVNYATSLANTAAQSTSSAGEIVKKVIRTLSDATPQFYSTGGLTGAGYGNGLSDYDIESRVSGFANRAVAAMKSALGIESPSKVARVLGEYTGEGYALGFESKLSSVERIAAEYGDAMRVQPDAYLYSNTYDTASMRDSIYGRGSNVSVTNYNLQIDGVEINSRPEMRQAFIEFMSTLNRLGVM